MHRLTGHKPLLCHSNSADEIEPPHAGNFAEADKVRGIAGVMEGDVGQYNSGN